MPYEEYDDMLFSGKLQLISVNYVEKWVTVRDKNFDIWKVIYEPIGNLAILEKVI